MPHHIPSRYQRSTNPQTYKEAILKFATLSTIRGVKRITLSANWIWSLIWVTAIFISMGAIIYQLSLNVSTYLRYQVIQTHLEHLDNYINYPSVTICPLQPFNSNFSQPYVSKEYLNGDDHILEYLEKLERKRETGELSEAMLTLDTEGLATIVGYYQNIKPENVRKFGHALDSLIIDCKIERTDAETGLKQYSACSNISHIFSAQYFNCYTITIPDSVDSSVSKLSIIVYLDDFGTIHYPTTLSDDFQSQMHGVKVVIHEDDTWPDVMAKGDEIAPGNAATFFIKELEKSLESPPWGNCSQIPAANRTLTDYSGKVYKYTQNLCKKYISQKDIINECKCKLALLPVPDLEGNISATFFCDDIDLSMEDMEKMMACTQKLTQNLRDHDFDDELDEMCPLPCHINAYSYIKALSQWPHDAYHLAFYKKFIKAQPFANKFVFYENITVLKDKDYKEAYQKLLESDLIERNFIKLEFKMEPTVRTIRQEPKMTDTQLLSNIGGTLSLWLGISTIAILEIAEFLADIFRIYKLRNTNNVMNVSATEYNNTVPSVRSNSSGFNTRINNSISSLGGAGHENGHAPELVERYSKFNESWWF